MTASPPVGARERILATAFRLFYAHGIRGVGVDAIIAESGVAKATFYKHFPSKDDLVLAYLDRADAAWMGALKLAAAAAGPKPREQLVGMFDALVAACRTTGYHGCAFISTASEATPGTAVHARAMAHKQAVNNWVQELAIAAGADEPDRLARGLTLLLDGGLSAGVLDADPGAAEAAQRAAGVLVDAALRHPGPRSR
ncbi:MAG TPA: TetR/AcrR family transcriptional regulator [Acidimicrobiales bacterium]|nr:TetR/AcrR family transcriptional regulator [Acidimicrobiales bacterium]